MTDFRFITSTMNGGKTTVLLQTVHSWRTRGLNVLLIKPWKDTRDTNIVSRIGAQAEVDIRLKKTDSVLENLEGYTPDLIVVDEAQFLSVNQIEDLFTYSMLNDVKVYCYGLKTDFTGRAFPGSIRLLELADITELDTMICRCGKKAKFNARFNSKTGELINEGPKTLIEGSIETITYDPLCGKCYIELGGFQND